MILLRKGFMEYIDYFISNDDVEKPKPDPEMYLKCIDRSGFQPHEILIFEDSEKGIQAAQATGCVVSKVANPESLTYASIKNIIKSIENPNIKYNILIPMSGYGSRFTQAGYKLPKPLIKIKTKRQSEEEPENEWKPMIQIVVENLIDKFGLDNQFIFIVQHSHCIEYNLPELFMNMVISPIIFTVEGVTEGACCSALLAKSHINNDRPLIIANSDQFIEWCEPVHSFSSDGLIYCFPSNETKWSYAKTDGNRLVTEVAEKKVISEHATCGIYYFQKGSDFVSAAEEMIEKNIRVNNEFYICPVFNQLIAKGKKIEVESVKKMWGIGTPDDLEYFIENYEDEL